MTNPETPSLVEAATRAITEILRKGYRPILAFSGGKDSTCIMLLTLDAARKMRERGEGVPDILVTHGDTGIENPTVALLVRNELRKAREFGSRHGFRVETQIASPLLNDTWAVSIIGGRALPTFVNSGSRDCTIRLKVNPMNRLRRQLLIRSDTGAGAPITLVGTRYDESASRSARMTERQETAEQPWEREGQWYLSPIAYWSMDDVWEYLGQHVSGALDGYTDAADVFEMYASAMEGNSCAVVGDLASEGAKKSRACGARFGCSLCCAVGRDKSMEGLLSHPENAWLRPVNRIQRFLVDTQYDWSLRNWIGRTLDEGFISITPDTYSPSMLADLLRYCLTADALEARAAARLGIAPRFTLVTQEQLLAIDALWSLHGLQERPFAALQIWSEVHEMGRRFYPPELETPVPHAPKPAARYLKVGDSWDGENSQTYSGFRNPILELAEEGSGCMGTRRLADGRIVMETSVSPSFSFDAEAIDLFFQFEMEYVLEQHYHDPRSVCTQAFFHYCQLGMLSTSQGHVQKDIDRILRRTAWKLREGLVGDINVEAVLRRTVSKVEVAQSKDTDIATHSTNATSASGAEGCPTERVQLELALA